MDLVLVPILLIKFHWLIKSCAENYGQSQHLQRLKRDHDIKIQLQNTLFLAAVA